MRNHESTPAPMNTDNLERIDNNANQEASAEIRSVNQARGHEVNEAVIAEREGLNQERDELLDELQAYGITLEDLQPKQEAEAPKIELESEVEVSPSAVAEKLKKNPGFKKYIRGAIIAVVATIGIGVGAKVAKASAGGGFITPESNKTAPVMTEVAMQQTTTPELTTVTFENTTENTKYAGEMPNGLSYDYTEYADRSNKVAYNAYGHDYSSQFNNRTEATSGILHMAEQEPEALASYAYNIFTDAEKKELGIDGLTMVQIDNKFSDDANGGALQKSVLNKFSQILNDQENTNFKFYHENGTEQTNYVYFVDENKDGNLTPDELHLGYDTKKRTNAPQVDISRTIKNADGTTTTKKMLDLNMACGYQPNYEQAPAGVPKINENKPVTQVLTGGGASTTIITGGGGTPEDPKDPKKPKPKDDPVPPPKDDPAPKDAENLIRIDKQINKDIADDIGTGVVNPGYNPGVSQDDKTEKPTGDDYGGIAPTIEQNDDSRGAEDVQPTSPANDYGQDQGGANDGNANENPVESNDVGQHQADQNETPQEQAPTSGAALDDALADLGIN